MPFPVDLPPAFLMLASSLGIRSGDIEEQFTRGSGHGGQKINKTASAVHLRHGPTGIEVKCQPYREQSRNRMAAYKLLLLKIEERLLGQRSQRRQELFVLRKQKQRRSRKATEKMLGEKHRRSSIKEQRRGAWRETM